MNSEELEQSLRTEFENYLNDTFGEMRSELTELQAKVSAEIGKHKEQLEAVFQEAMNRVPTRKELDSGFKDSVIEHLRLARDEGASITAAAFAEAEEMDRQTESSTVGFGDLREAINDISSKNSQSEILKSLVKYAEMFAPRGAFFIIKNEHFVGWKTFGAEKNDTEETVRDIFFPVASNSILSTAVNSLSMIESSSNIKPKDAEFLEKLGFGSPHTMFAIPLIARGRGVAVLYADGGEKGSSLNTDGLETLVRVASLTVEVLASAKGSGKKKSSVSEVSDTGFSMPSVNQYESNYQQPSYQSSFDSQPAFQSNYQSEPVVQSFDSYSSAKEESTYFPPPASESYSEPLEQEESYNEPQTQEENSYSVSYDDSTWKQPETYTSYEDEQVSTKDYSADYEKVNDTVSEPTDDFSYQPDTGTETPVNEYQAENLSSFEEPTYGEIKHEEPAESVESFTSPTVEKPAVSSDFENNSLSNFTIPQEIVAPPAQTTAPTRSRFSDRNVDLPIEVTEDERRLHNDARRFARLLVSEIKLYNEAKVKEGREANDLYERLREAIDRSREMYDKRVQPNVAAKFDYFHYELVNSLGEGDASKLGDSYPGASI